MPIGGNFIVSFWQYDLENRGCNNAMKGKVMKYTYCFYLLVISPSFTLSIWNVNILLLLSYIYGIQSDFEFEKKITILLDVVKGAYFLFDISVSDTFDTYKKGDYNF